MSTKKKPAREGTATLTTRMESKQRALIEEAAAVLDCSPGKFVRDAAVQRAADVLNASGSARAQLRELAKRLVDHCFHCRIKEKGVDKEPCLESGLFEPMELNVGGLLDSTPPEETGNRWHSIVRTDAKDGIRRAMETTPTEFVRLVLDEWDNWGKADLDYQPRVDPDEVLD